MRMPERGCSTVVKKATFIAGQVFAEATQQRLVDTGHFWREEIRD